MATCISSLLTVFSVAGRDGQVFCNLILVSFGERGGGILFLWDMFSQSCTPAVLQSNAFAMFFFYFILLL